MVHENKKNKIPKWIDWHDHVRIEADSKRTGPGEQGNSVILLENEHSDDAYKGASFEKKFNFKLGLLF